MATELGDCHPQTVIDDADPGETIVAAREIQHTISEPLSVGTPGLTLRGLNLALADGADENLVEITADGVSAVDFVLDGNRSNQTGDRQTNGIVVTDASNVTVAGGHVSNVSRHGVRVVDTSTPTSYVEGNEPETPEASGTSDVTVRGVRVDSPRRDGCSIEGPNVENVTVDNVRTFGSDDRGSVEIKDGTSDAIVTNCYAEDCRYGCAVQDHSTYGVTNVVLANNTAVNCDTAIDAQNSVRHRQVVVAGNTGRDITGDGLGGVGGIQMKNIDGLVVSNNLLDGVGDTGIHVTNCTRAQVTGNVVSGTTAGPGIGVDDAPGAVVNNNVVEGAATHGIQCRAVDGEVTDAQFCHNRCVDSEGYGVQLVEADGAVDHVLVATNSVRNNGKGGIDDATTGGNVVADNLW